LISEEKSTTVELPLEIDEIGLENIDTFGKLIPFQARVRDLRASRRRIGHSGRRNRQEGEQPESDHPTQLCRQQKLLYDMILQSSF
jgi:hypothetical protein